MSIPGIGYRLRRISRFTSAALRGKERAAGVAFHAESVLAWLLLATVFVGCTDLVKLMIQILKSPPTPSYALLETFLGHTLLLVVGLELAAMLLKRSTGSVIEVMMFVVARKVIVQTKTTLDLVVGVAAIAGLFAIRRFLFIHRIEDTGAVLSAATRVRDANVIAGVSMPLDLAETLGGLIHHLAGGKVISGGDRFHIADADIRVLRIQDGVVERVRVVSLQQARDE